MEYGGYVMGVCLCGRSFRGNGAAELEISIDCYADCSGDCHTDGIFPEQNIEMES